jgi:hypothetical protein
MNHEQDRAWLQHLRDAFSGNDLVEPPEWVRERARQLFRSGGPQASMSVVDRVRATLIFDSRHGGLAVSGVRSLGVLDGPWQLLYRGGDIDVDLLVRPNQDGHTMTVRGQALSLGGGALGDGVVEAVPADAPRQLHGRSVPMARSELEPSGEFALANLERGRYDVWLRFGAHEVELCDVEL